MCLRSSGIPWIKLSLFLLLLKFPMALFEHTVCKWARFTVSLLTFLLHGSHVIGSASDAHLMHLVSWIIMSLFGIECIFIFVARDNVSMILLSFKVKANQEWFFFIDV